MSVGAPISEVVTLMPHAHRVRQNGALRRHPVHTLAAVVATSFLLCGALASPGLALNRRKGLLTRTSSTTAPPTMPSTTDVSTPPVNTAVVGVVSLAFAPDIHLKADNDRITESMNVPHGLTPTRVVGRVGFPISDRVITFSVSVAGERIATLSSVSAGPGGTVSFDVALPPAAVVNNRASVDIETTRPGTGAVCDTSRSVANDVRLLDAGFVTIGQADPPTTIASFFGPGVTRVSIWSADVKSDPAAVQMAAGVVHRLGPATQVTLHRGAPPRSAPTSGAPLSAALRVTGLERDVVFATATQANTAVAAGLGRPTLHIDGQPTAQIATARALAQPEADIADAPKSGASSAVDRVYGRSTMTIATLTGTRAAVAPGVPGPQLIGTGLMKWEVSVPQSRFGGPVGHISIHIRGRTTPIDRGSYGDFAILWNGAIVHAAPLGDATDFEARAEVPRSLVGRDNTLTLQARYTPGGGACQALANPIQIDIDPLSTVSADAGQTLPAGFTRFPQVLRGRFRYATDVGVRTNAESASALSSAGLLAAAMQRLSPDLLSTIEVPLSRIADGTAGVVVSASPATVLSLQAPFRFGTSRVIAADGASVAFEIAGPVGALQAFQYRNTDLIVASGTTATLANNAVAAMMAHPDGWYHLSDQIQILRSNATELIDVPSQRYVEVVPDELALATDGTNRHKLPNWAMPVGLTLLAVLVVRGLLEATRLIRLRRIAAGVVARNGLPTPRGAQLDKRRDDRRVSSTPPSRPRLERRRADRRDVGDHTTSGADHTSPGHGSESPED